MSSGEHSPPGRETPPRRTLGSLLWALAVPLMFTLAGWVAQYPSGFIFVGVALALGTLAVAAVRAGHVWRRGGAALLVCCSGLALTLFAGPGLYDLYMEQLGEPAPAVVLKVRDGEQEPAGSGPGSDNLFCTVAETTGDRTVHELSQQQNCFGQFPEGRQVTLRKDPLGLLKPRLPDGPGQTGTDVEMSITAGLFVLTAAAMFYAGRRRR